jgi:hypothetical protein
MYYIKNLETEKLNIIFTKEEYKALPPEKRQCIKSNCIFNGSIWISKAKADNAWFLLARLQEWNIEYKGEEGTERSFAGRSPSN